MCQLCRKQWPLKNPFAAINHKWLQFYIKACTYVPYSKLWYWTYEIFSIKVTWMKQHLNSVLINLHIEFALSQPFLLVPPTDSDFIGGIHNITGKAVCISRPGDWHYWETEGCSTNGWNNSMWILNLFLVGEAERSCASGEP